MTRLVCLFCGLLLSLAVTGNDAPHSSLTLDQSFAAQRAAIEAALLQGDIYKEISDEDRATVMQHLRQLSLLLTEATTVAALGPARQTAVINSQELVNQLLTRAAEDSRLVCVAQQRLGTRIRESVCMTKAERAHFNSSSRKDVDDRLGLCRGQDIKTIGKPLSTPLPADWDSGASSSACGCVHLGKPRLTAERRMRQQQLQQRQTPSQVPHVTVDDVRTAS